MKYGNTLEGRFSIITCFVEHCTRDDRHTFVNHCEVYIPVIPGESIADGEADWNEKRGTEY